MPQKLRKHVDEIMEDENNLEANGLPSMYLSFSISKAWHSLYTSKCKLWDDPELDLLEGIKFFAYMLGQLCYTAEFLLCTQSINPWII